MLETLSVVMLNIGLQFKMPEGFLKIQHPWAAHMSRMHDMRIPIQALEYEPRLEHKS
jgi:hypothetical protein